MGCMGCISIVQDGEPELHPYCSREGAVPVPHTVYIQYLFPNIKFLRPGVETTLSLLAFTYTKLHFFNEISTSIIPGIDSIGISLTPSLKQVNPG